MRVLFVEDEAAIGAIVALELERAIGAEVEHVESGVAALALMQAESWSLVITDLHLRGHPTGTDVADAARGAGVPVVVWSGLVGLAPTSADVVVEKDGTLDRLITAVRSLLCKS